MSVVKIPVRIDRIQTKVNKLIQLHIKVKGEKEKLQTEKEDLLQSLQQGRLAISELEEQNKRIKLAKSLSASGSNSSDIKLKINEMVKEIDKCIAYLNK